MSLFKKSSPLVRRKSTVANRGASQPTALESSMNLDQTHQSQLGTSGQWTLPHQQQSAMQPQAPPQGYAQPQHQSQAGLSSSLLQTTPMPFQPSNTGLLMASTATAVLTGTTAVVAPAPTPNAPPLAVNLGTAQLYFENGVWRSGKKNPNSKTRRRCTLLLWLMAMLLAQWVAMWRWDRPTKWRSCGRTDDCSKRTTCCATKWRCFSTWYMPPSSPCSSAPLTRTSFLLISAVNSV